MTTLPPPDIKFGRFLFAPILERDGLSLTVLSAFTRLDLDPWQEAARLSALPQDEAINSLAATIWKTNSAIVTADEAAVLATRLILLLPHKRALTEATVEQSADFATAWFVFAIFLVMMAVSGSQSNRLAEPGSVALQQTQSTQPQNEIGSSFARKPPE